MAPSKLAYTFIYLFVQSIHLIESYEAPPSWLKRGPLPHIETNYIIENPDICDNDTEIFIWVHTAPRYTRKRLTLRQTWANSKEPLAEYKMKTGFFMGRTLNETEQTEIIYEDDLYRDIVQEDFIDSYWNMSYKAIAGTRWITRNCPQAKLIIKCDDDALIDLPVLLKNTARASKGVDILNIKKTAIGRIFQRSPVNRGNKKWALTQDEYQDAVFPNYCQGLALMLSADLVPLMYKTSQKTPILWVDDAWMFGIVLKPLKPKFISFKQANDNLVRQMPGKIKTKRSFSYHIHEVDIFWDMYNNVLKREGKFKNEFFI